MKQNRVFHFLDRYRWGLISFFLLFSVTAYLDLKPLGQQFYTLTMEVQQTMLQVEEKEKALQELGMISDKLGQLRTQENKNTLLDQVLQTAFLNHCDFASLVTASEKEEGKKIEQPSGWLLRINLSGEFSNFFQFLAALHQQKVPLLLNDMVLKPQEEVLNISLQFTVFPLAFEVSDTSKAHSDKAALWCCSRSPFQTRLDTFLPFAGQDPSLQVLGLEDLRYVGYLAQGGKKGALLLLPNGAVQDVYQEAILGKAKWQLLKIEPGFLTLRTQDGVKEIKIHAEL